MSSQYFRFSARGAGAPCRSSLLEQLLARADALRPVSDWRADAFRIIAPQASRPAIASAALLADCGAVDAAWVCLATPVHYVADMTSVRLPRDGMLPMQCATASMLAVDFNRVWKGSGFRLMAGGSAQLYCLVDQALEVETRDPEEALERRMEEFQPSGLDAPRLRLLMSEIEMWLFEHEANAAREALSLPRISGLWLWGGGAPLAALPRIEGWIAGDDVFFRAFGDRGAGKSASAVIVAQTPGGCGWDEMEKRWLKPASAQLRSGRLSQLEISAGDRCWSLSARAMWRFWRRGKPWWESFA